MIPGAFSILLARLALADALALLPSEPGSGPRTLGDSPEPRCVGPGRKERRARGDSRDATDDTDGRRVVRDDIVVGGASMERVAVVFKQR